jgi:hypothetical protein
LVADAVRAVRELPDGNPAAAVITFHGGDHVVPTGGMTEDPSAVRHLLTAFFHSSDGLPRELGIAAMRLTRAVLQLAQHVSSAARLDRCGAVLPQRDAVVAAALRLSSPELDAIGGRHRDALDPLITDDVEARSWAATPLLRHRQGYVLAGADQLLVSLRHHLILLAREHGWLPTLLERLRDVYEFTIGQSLEAMGWTDTGLVSDVTQEATQMLWQIDRDAIAVVSVLYDDLGDYDADEPDTQWHAEQHIDAVAAHGRGAAEALLSDSQPPDRLLHMVVLAGVGRPSMWFDLAPDSVLQVRQVSFYAADLEVIGIAERNDPLALWRYGEDADRLTSRVITEDPLEQFALWRSERHSFYLGDGHRPTMMYMSQDRSGALRTEVAQARDRHSMVGPPGRQLVEVVRRFDDIPVPLYSPLPVGILGVAVDTGEFSAWVLAAEPGRMSSQIVDAVAFWLWQLAEHDVLSGRLSVTVQVGDAGEIEIVESEPGHLRLTLDPMGIVEFRSPDNEGERLLVRRLLTALAGEAPELDLEAIVDEVAPLGFKKMILLFGPNADAALDSRRLPRWRLPLRESDEGQAMDELGEHLRETVGLLVGPISADQRGKVLWQAITFHIDQLLTLIATLDPRDLLKTLTEANESLLSKGAFDRYVIPTRIACYEAENVVGQLRRDFEQHASASSAVRFVIECVAAHPPAGLRPVTMSVRDRLVALAAQVVARGGVADAVREGLDDTEISILESGRLGVSREGRFFAGRERFHDRFMDAQVRRAHLHFPSLSDDEEDPSEEALANAALLDEAAGHEWGMTLTDIITFFAALVDLSGREPSTTMPVDQAVKRLSATLAWDRNKVETAIDRFSLRPREKLLEPEDPFLPSDVYPWRFGRRLSVLRQPLVIRPADEGNEIVYGFRAVDAAGRLLVDDISSARLKATSAEMKRAITILRQRDDERFNSEVAALYEAVPGIVVRQQVDKVGRLAIARLNGQSLGDIDVLAADPSKQVIHAVEVKNLAVGRTPFEIAREWKRTFKSEGSKPAAIDRHAERCDWLSEHMAEVIAWLGLEDSGRWRIEPSIVVNTEVTSSFIEDLPMRVFDVAELEELLEQRKLR